MKPVMQKINPKLRPNSTDAEKYATFVEAVVTRKVVPIIDNFAVGFIELKQQLEYQSKNKSLTKINQCHLTENPNCSTII